PIITNNIKRNIHILKRISNHLQKGETKKSSVEQPDKVSLLHFDTQDLVGESNKISGRNCFENWLRIDWRKK
ncbi:hypothetical protein Avbf_16338, partial [Armadillidium vulgare]